MRRSSGSFFIFRESFLTVPGDRSLSLTFFWEVGLASGHRSSRSEQLTHPEAQHKHQLTCIFSAVLRTGAWIGALSWGPEALSRL